MPDESLNAWLAGVAARAAGLAERRAGAAEPVRSEESDRLAQERLDLWLKLVGRGDAKLLDRRLAWEGLDRTTAATWLGGVRAPDGDRPLPAWTAPLRASLEAGFADADRAWIDDPARRPACYLAGQELAFEEVFVPFVVTAGIQARAAVGPAAQLLAPAAWLALERHLLAFLSRRSERALFLEFSIERQAARFAAQVTGTDPDAVVVPGARDRYRAFVRRLWAERGLLDFLGEYCVLARQLGTLVQLWVEAVAEFLARLQADLPELRREFCAGREPGLVTELAPFLSDRHFRGRGVMALTFASGDRVVYKPKGLSAETAYYALLDWCNARRPPLPLKVLRVLDRGTHGWVESVEALPCADEAAVRRYYTRAGMFLALAYALEATDCHYENIIACGEHPMLIDLETLLHGRPRPESGRIEGAHELASQQMQDSVLRTMFLPRWEFGPNGESYDISGLGGGAGMATPFRTAVWREINTDTMTLAEEPIQTQGDTNTPRLRGEPVRYTDYLPELIAGFTEMYRWVLARRGELLAADGPLERGGLKRQRLRYLLRHTKVYFSLLKNSAQPDRLRDGAAAAIHFDVLARAFLGDERPPAAWPVVAFETAGLMLLDVPFFHAMADSRALHPGTEPPIPDFFLESGAAALDRRLALLSEKDLEQQLLFIKSALHAREALAHTLTARSGRDEQPAPENPPPLTPERCREIADEIGGELARRAVRSESARSATWVSFEFIESAGRYELLPMGYRLYEGITGPALFLGALAAETGRDDYRGLAGMALFSLRQGLREAPDKIAAELGVGAGMGLGSIVYALTRLATSLDQPELRDDARRAAALLTPGRIAADRRFDLLFGAAGALLVLLASPDLEPEADWRARIAACGDHLLKHRAAAANGLRAWPTGDGGALLTGFSHGAAGIAYALARAAAVTGREDFLAAAREAVRYENSQFSVEQANWLDHRELPESAAGMPLCSWCHGAPGILLGRAAGLPWLDDGEIRTDLERGAAAIRAHRIEFIDQLCCGNLGRAEILGAAGTLAGRPEWLEAGRRLSARVAARAGRAENFGVNWRGGPFHAGFFQGVTGIGYHFLRLAHPERHPCVLLWQ